VVVVAWCGNSEDDGVDGDIGTRSVNSGGQIVSSVALDLSCTHYAPETCAYSPVKNVFINTRI
jgi:hypothetical protein